VSAGDSEIESPAPDHGSLHEQCAARVETEASGTDQLVPATAPRTTSPHEHRRLASRLGSLGSVNAESRRLARTPLYRLTATLPATGLTFPVGAETRRLDADARFKVAWSNPDAVRLSDLLGWQAGSLDVVCVNGWIVLTQPSGLGGVTPTRNGAHARFSIDQNCVERIGLKNAHVRSLNVVESRTVLVAPVPAA
jgi:hypothetical protein